MANGSADQYMTMQTSAGCLCVLVFSARLSDSCLPPVCLHFQGSQSLNPNSKALDPIPKSPTYRLIPYPLFRVPSSLVRISSIEKYEPLGKL